MNQRRYGVTLLWAVSICLVPSAGVQSQEFDTATQTKWMEELSKEIGNPPERGQVPLDAFKGAARIIAAGPAPNFNRYFSLLVTDIDTVRQFSFSAVMNQFARQSDDPSLGKETLFHQWWDSANPKPSLLLGPHCDDIPKSDLPYECQRPEGAQAFNGPLNKKDVFAEEDPNNAAEDPAHVDAYSAIAVSNRYDLRSPPQDAGNGMVRFADCGEYRIIFALNSGRTIPASLSKDNATHPGNILKRNLISFEFRVPNPSANQAQKPGEPLGCAPILQFWYGLSASMTAKARGALLVDFFMNGEMKTPDNKVVGKLPSPVVDIWKLTFGQGQIRTNQFMNTVTNTPAVPPTDYTKGVPAQTNIDPNDWILREFRTLMSVSNKKVLGVLIVPVTTKSTPRSDLLTSIDNAKPADIDPRRLLLLQHVREQTATLLGGQTNGQFTNLKDINSISFSALKPGENAFESDEGSPIPCPPSNNNTSKCSNPLDGKGNILDAFGSQASNNDLSIDFQADLDDAGVTPAMAIAPINLVDRLRTQTCAGCHQFSDTKKGQFGFDNVGLGGGAVWPTKACGDYEPSCTLPQDSAHPADAFLLKDPNKLHPPMQFTQISEVILTPSAADNGQGWRYAISSTVECMLDFRERVMKAALGFSPVSADHCPH